MLPIGCKHLPFPDIDKIARKLKIDYADAVVGFAFKNGRAAPKIQGIVVCAEEEEIILKTYREYQLEMQRLLREAEKLEEIKKTKIMRRLLNLIDEFKDSPQQQERRVENGDQIYRGKRKKKVSQEEFSFDKL